MNEAQVLSASQMREAEQALLDDGASVFDLMKTAGAGAAEWVRRIAAARSVTILCGPGNNGGDGYVIAHVLRKAGGDVRVIAPLPPKTAAARQALALWDGPVQTSGGAASGEVLVDCLFGTGLTRPLSGEHALMLRDLAKRHQVMIAVDLPSGVDSDSGAILNEKLPVYDLTLALGAWKFAHWTLPARERMGNLKLVPIGIGGVEGAAQLSGRPRIRAPRADSHKYRRGLAAIVGGAMPGAAILASEAALRGGAGYVKLLAEAGDRLANPSLVQDSGALDEALADDRIGAVLAGPGLGRGAESERRMKLVLAAGLPCVLDADALILLRPEMVAEALPILATPHDGELATLCRNFAVLAETRRDRAAALAKVSKMVILAKGPDTVIAAPDGRIAIIPPAPSWLSVAGSGDVLAGIAVSRMAGGADPFHAALGAVWLHGEAARICGAAFTPLDLARAVSDAMARGL